MLNWKVLATKTGSFPNDIASILQLVRLLARNEFCLSCYIVLPSLTQRTAKRTGGADAPAMEATTSLTNKAANSAALISHQTPVLTLSLTSFLTLRYN